MYSTCLFCNESLGRNEVIEQFPVGRRLAFDAAQGRLWAVCTHCKRWNLSPFDTRWEAIEEAERQFRDARMRVATEHIGMARLREGLELVRIGQPLLPEFAAWRYGAVFRNRARRATAWGVAALVPTVVSMGTNMSMAAHMVTIGLFGSIATTGFTVGQIVRDYRRAHVPRLAVRNEDKLLWLSHRDANSTELVNKHDGEWTLRMAHRVIQPTGALLRLVGKRERVLHEVAHSRLEGESARRALATILPTVNRAGGGKKTIAEAIEVVSAHGNLARSFLAREDSEGRSFLNRLSTQLSRLPAPYRLGLEMSLHEADERRALEGELSELETRWREAEEIAAISDGMFVSTEIEARLQVMQRQTDLLTASDR